MSYTYSLDEERYTGDFETRAQALGAAHDELAERLAEVQAPLTVWTAVRTPVDVPALVRDYTDTVLEDLAEAVGEEFGEFAEDWPPVPGTEARAALDAALREVVVAWVAAHCSPAFFSIDETSIEQHEVR